MLQVLFLIIFFCNIPVTFMAGKIALLAIVDQCCFKERQERARALLAADSETDDNNRDELRENELENLLEQ